MLILNFCSYFISTSNSSSWTDISLGTTCGVPSSRAGIPDLFIITWSVTHDLVTYHKKGVSGCWWWGSYNGRECKSSSSWTSPHQWVGVDSKSNVNSIYWCVIEGCGNCDLLQCFCVVIWIGRAAFFLKKKILPMIIFLIRKKKRNDKKQIWARMLLCVSISHWKWVNSLYYFKPKYWFIFTHSSIIILAFLELSVE